VRAEGEKVRRVGGRVKVKEEEGWGGEVRDMGKDGRWGGDVQGGGSGVSVCARERERGVSQRR